MAGPGLWFADSNAITVRFDYAGRTDSNPVYIGLAQPGSSDSDVASTDWQLKLFAYDASARVISIKVASAVAWANRTAVTYQ